MGFLANLFGGNKEKALREVLAHIHRILDDQAFQLELVHLAMKAMLESAPEHNKGLNDTSPLGSSRLTRYRSTCVTGNSKNSTSDTASFSVQQELP